VLQITPWCQLSLPGCTITATEVDHVVSWAQGVAQGMTTQEIDSVENAQAVCATCHKTKTQVEAAHGRAQRSVAKPTQRHPGLRP
jgi:5-methylcytosine-specific restriction protein A